MTLIDELKGEANESELIVRIENTLKTLGIPKPPQNLFPCVYEYQYLCEAILLAITDEQFKNKRLTKSIYTVIAKTYAKKCLATTKRVERGITKEILVGWGYGDPDIWKSYFGYSILERSKGPTNFQFISAIASLCE